MTINFSAYGVKSNDMASTDLEVGQKLIRLIAPSNDYTPYTKSEYTVKKILKTRLILEDGAGNELRLLVDTKAWSYRKNMVQTDREGDSQSYRRTAFQFATLDDEQIIDDAIARRQERLDQQERRNKASITAREIASQIRPTLESVDAAIAALQALRGDLTN